MPARPPLLSPPLRAVFCALAALALAAVALAAEDVEVSSDSVQYAAAGGDAVFSGNVVIGMGGMSARAATLFVQKAEAGNVYVAVGAPVSLACDDCAAVTISVVVGEELRYDAGGDRVQMSGGVSVCAGDNCAAGWLRAESADWRRAEDSIVMRGAPMVRARWLPPGEAAAVEIWAERVRYSPQSGDARFIGDARVRRGDNDIRGDEIYFNVKTGALSAKAAAGGRVKATFDRAQP